MIISVGAQTDDRQKEIHLDEGWNMISSPFQSVGFYLEGVRDDCQLRQYDSSYAWFYNGGWKHPNAFAPTQGVLIYSTSSCNAKINEISWPVSGDPVENDKELKRGWNMISVPEPMTLSEIEGSCKFLDYEGTPVWHYMGDLGWQQLGRSTNELKPEKGYYVKVESACSLDFEGVKPPPTPK